MPSPPCAGLQGTPPALSRRIQVTDDAPINKILGHIARSGRDVLSLAQGGVWGGWFWGISGRRFLFSWPQTGRDTDPGQPSHL